MNKKILLVCLSVILTACSLLGPQLPVSNGVYYLQNNNTYNLLTANQGAPDSNNYNNLPKIKTTPEFLFCGAQIQIDSITLVNVVDYSQHIFSHKTKGNDCIEISINESLSDGVYCFSQNDPLASPNELLNWCFIVGNPSLIENFNPDSEIDIQDDNYSKLDGENENFTDKTETKLEDIIRFKLISFNEIPAEPGYKYLDFQVLIQNISNDHWVIISDWPHAFSGTLTTAEGFHYGRESHMRVDYKKGEESLSNYPYESASLSLHTLPPGFHTLVSRDRWKISEFATNPILNIELKINEIISNESSAFNVMHTFDLPLNGENLTEYPITPFINNLSWKEYKQNYSSNIVFPLEVGETSIAYEFGEVTFLGIEINEQLRNDNLVVSFEFKNGSLGYPLNLLGKFGLFVEGGVGFHKNLGWPISSLDDYSTDIAPGQTAKVGYIIEDEVDYTKNWKNPFPVNYDQWEKPFCVIIQELWCESENIRTTFDVNIVACQDNYFFRTKGY